MENTSPYKMTVDLNVLDHLADGLYSSVAAVITETVANAWDADAGNVWITIEEDRLAITDDGIGMNTDGVNERYLKVGYRRRKNEGDRSQEGRPVMGRKGIGKLSLFSIAKQVDIFTRTQKTDPIGLRISTTDLREAMDRQDEEYHPIPVDIPANVTLGEHGTCIVASKLKERIREVSPSSLKRRIARRFSIIGKEDSGTKGTNDFFRGFHVFVNDEEVTSADRDDLKFVEYLWGIGEEEIDTSRCEEGYLKEKFILQGSGNGLKEGETVNGWIGTVDKPKRLATSEGNLNSIIVLARGRLVDEDVLSRITGAEMYTKYLTGQIEADFLDNEDNDIVTSNRQRLIEDDPRFERLKVFLKACLRNIASSWSETRTRDKVTELGQKYPKVAEWINSLETGWKRKAEKLLQKIATLEIEDDENQDNRKMLLRHAIFGFERLRLRGDEEELERALEAGVNDLLCLLSGKDDLEAALYFDIVSNRLEIIKILNQFVDEDQKERVLQEYLFNHLWLLDPSWERAAEAPSMEERLRLCPGLEDNEETKATYGRIDIRYRTISGKHVIIELKRASVITSIFTLAEQGSKYVDALKKILPMDARNRSVIEVVFVIGKPLPEDRDRVFSILNGVSPGSQIVTYEQLIQSAKASYDEYIVRAERADRISRMFDS